MHNSQTLLLKMHHEDKAYMILMWHCYIFLLDRVGTAVDLAGHMFLLYMQCNLLTWHWNNDLLYKQNMCLSQKKNTALLDIFHKLLPKFPLFVFLHEKCNALQGNLVVVRLVLQ